MSVCGCGMIYARFQPRLAKTSCNQHASTSSTVQCFENLSSHGSQSSLKISQLPPMNSLRCDEETIPTTAVFVTGQTSREGTADGLAQAASDWTENVAVLGFRSVFCGLRMRPKSFSEPPS